MSLREQIKEVATELLIKNGYQGFRFRDVAERLNITRTTIHYYFGNKKQLAEEVIVEYVQYALKSYGDIWLNEALSLEKKIILVKEETKRRYLKYNPTGRTGAPWSLLGRMRIERDLLSGNARAAVERYGERLERFIFEGIDAAVRKGELAKTAPIKDLSFQLVTITNSAGPITQDDGSFDRLEEVYLGFSRIVRHAYGVSPSASGT